LIEAFEIGVSLALQDGVSDGLSLAQRNLAALEKAVSSSGVAIQSLRDAGLRASSIPVSISRDQPPSSPVPQGVKNTKLVEPGADAIVQGVIDDSQPDTKEISNIHSVVEPADQAGVLTPDQTQMSVFSVALQPQAKAPTRDDRPADLRAGEPVASEQIYKHEHSPSAPPAMEIPAPESSGLVFAMATPVQQPSPSIVPPAISHGQIPIENLNSADCISRPQSIGLALFSDLNVGARSSEQSDAKTMVVAVSEVRGSQVETQIQESSTAKAPVLPRNETDSGDWKTSPVFQKEDRTAGFKHGAWPGYPTERPRVSDTPMVDDQRKSHAPQLRRNHPQASSGDVYLDGMLVGRWVSRFMQKQAERADAGPTGFDAKRGRLLPGVTVGG
jgi:hypothetical protein